MTDQLTINEQIGIPLTDFEVSYSRSGGPGGQNVNKVNTKATLRWSVSTTDKLPEAARDRFLAKYASRITLEGEILITSQRYRDQPTNLEDCYEKLRAMVLSVLAAPAIRRQKKTSKAQKAKRVATKRQAGERKQQRSRPSLED